MFKWNKLIIFSKLHYSRTRWSYASFVFYSAYSVAAIQRSPYEKEKQAIKFAQLWINDTLEHVWLCASACMELNELLWIWFFLSVTAENRHCITCELQVNKNKKSEAKMEVKKKPRCRQIYCPMHFFFYSARQEAQKRIAYLQHTNRWGGWQWASAAISHYSTAAHAFYYNNTRCNRKTIRFNRIVVCFAIFAI